MAQHGKEFRTGIVRMDRSSLMQYFPIIHILFAADNQGKARHKEKERNFRKELLLQRKDNTSPWLDTSYKEPYLLSSMFS